MRVDLGQVAGRRRRAHARVEHPLVPEEQAVGDLAAPRVLVDLGAAVVFELSRPPRSKKNRRRIVHARGRPFVVPSREAVADAAEVSARAGEALARIGGRPWGPDAALCLDLVHDVATDRMTVTVRQVGILPARGRRGTRQDAHAAIETIADALQGVLFDDDRQIDCGSWRRQRA